MPRSWSSRGNRVDAQVSHAFVTYRSRLDHRSDPFETSFTTSAIEKEKYPIAFTTFQTLAEEDATFESVSVEVAGQSR